MSNRIHHDKNEAIPDSIYDMQCSLKWRVLIFVTAKSTQN